MKGQCFCPEQLQLAALGYFLCIVFADEHMGCCNNFTYLVLQYCMPLSVWSITIASEDFFPMLFAAQLLH